MVFKNISIEYFRGIRKSEIQDFSKVNLLLGKNNSGKTSILEAIFLLSGATNSQLGILIDQVRGYVHQDNASFRSLFYDLDYDSKIKIKGDMFEKDSYRILEISPSSNTTNQIKAENKSRLPNNIPNPINAVTSISQKTIDGLIYNSSIKTPHTEIRNTTASIYAEIDQNGLFNLKSSPPDNYRNFITSIYYVANSLVGGTEFTKQVDDTIKEKRKDEVIELLKAIDNKIRDYSFGANNIINFDIGLNSLIPFPLIGEGVKKFFNIIMHIKAVPGGILLIDEIDNGLHFSVLNTLWRVIFISAELTNCQIFLTTHNYEILKSLRQFLSKDENSKFRNVMKCYTLIKKENDEVEALKYEYENFEFLINRNIEIRGGD